VRDALRLFDVDNKGVISADHLREVLSSMGEKLDKKDIDMVV
jgi:Ca2+-binding EF-hand superfamily protein